MSKLTFNPDFSVSTASHTDVLSVFKPHAGKSLTIRHGMSVKEISEVVSENVIAVVKEQFEATKKQFQAKQEGK